jgi:hypothetical protein
MSVFTTRSLLSSLGVANRHSSEAAAAINWVVKDGAGRLGRFLFARWWVRSQVAGGWQPGAAEVAGVCCSCGYKSQTDSGLQAAAA